MKKLTYILISILFIQFQADAQISLKKAKSLFGGKKGGDFTVEEAGSALKEALVQGVTKGVTEVSATGGYLLNPEITIPFPPEAQNVEKKLRAIGLGSEVDKVVETINAAAEKAAVEAKDIFIAAIKDLTIKDAMNIVGGEDDAATEYLKGETAASLNAKFNPIIKSSLDAVGATKHWSSVMNSYNKIPLVKKVNPDLTDYVTQRAMQGLFLMIAKEELNIRDNPVARVSNLLAKVFN